MDNNVIRRKNAKNGSELVRNEIREERVKRNEAEKE